MSDADTRHPKSFDWRARLRPAPHAPGVYLMKDRRGRVVYVGKAADLNARLRSYFARSGDDRFFVPLLESTLGDIETVLTASAKEALLLENHLIKEHQPRWNVRLKDDKNFLRLRIDLTHDYPRVDIVRRRRRERPGTALYFGPYHSARSIRQTVRLIHRHFQLRSCSDRVLGSRSRPCLQHEIGRCPAPCVRDVSRDDYRERVDEVRLFLSGRGPDLLKSLRTQMKAAADQLDFERAGRLRDQIAAIDRSLQGQTIDLGRSDDLDAFGLYREGAEVTVFLMLVRRGLVTHSQAFHLADQPFPSADILADLVGRYYDGPDVTLPDVVLLPIEVEDADVRAEWLTERRGRRVSVRVPQRGRLRRLHELAERNAAQAYHDQKRAEARRERTLAGLQRRLSLPVLPHRIECYDISQLQGDEAVGSRVVFTDGEPDNAQYRHYRIRHTEGQNDFSMMFEVLQRRFRPSKGKPDPPPNLIVVDGGKGQLGVARAVLADLAENVPDLPTDRIALAGLAKSRITDHERSTAPERSPERVFLPGRKNPVILRPNSSELYVLQRLRDEAHRFAITFHRKSRRKRNLASPLETISGVGPSRRRLLLTHFGSLERLRAADLPALKAVPGLPEAVAERVFCHLHPPSAG